MQCRPSCGACCIAPSISSPIPGMPNGKAAGEHCIHLSLDWKCNIFNDASRPKVCADFQADDVFCGNNRDVALINLTNLESDTK
ncbi:YkgJ family cysteine cluster protein [Marinomonas agarivorans]|nr:YkgJ family cysteine cluster protein [Marinomonas agarivorans]